MRFPALMVAAVVSVYMNRLCFAGNFYDEALRQDGIRLDETVRPRRKNFTPSASEIRPPVYSSGVSYRVFARKYRPQTFEEVLGQEHITRTLQNAISSGRVAQAYLFVGPRGIGKTSTARILAKALNCAEGPAPDSLRQMRCVQGDCRRAQPGRP